MKIYIFVFLLILSFKCYSQHFPTMDSEPVWHVLYWADAQTRYGHTETINFIGDTLHCGKTYEILRDNSDSFYLRTDSAKTFIKFDLDCDSIEYLLYDFGLATGDTIYVPLMIQLGKIDTIPIRVNSVYQIQNNDLQRTAMEVLYSPDGDFNFFRSMTWISGIGSTLHPIYSTHYPIDAWETDFRLLCYDSLNINVYKDTNYNTCDTTFNGWVGIDNSLNQSNIFVYPNPTNDLISISGLTNNDSYIVQIININGKLLLSLPLNNHSIDISGLRSGLYLLIVKKNSTHEIIYNNTIIKQPSPKSQ